MRVKDTKFKELDRNLHARVKNNRLVIVIKLDERPKTSNTGKSEVLASTQVNRLDHLGLDGYQLALNLYKSYR